MYYFAYGSNMSVAQMEKRKTHFSSRVLATLSGYRLVFDKTNKDRADIGFANIVKDSSSVVHGCLYDIDYIESLDSKEGYPEHYNRIDVHVLPSGEYEEVRAWAYIAQTGKTAEGLKPTHEYMSRLLAGRDILPADYVQMLEGVETID